MFVRYKKSRQLYTTKYILKHNITATIKKKYQVADWTKKTR